MNEVEWEAHLKVTTRYWAKHKRNSSKYPAKIEKLHEQQRIAKALLKGPGWYWGYGALESLYKKELKLTSDFNKSVPRKDLFEQP